MRVVWRVVIALLLIAAPAVLLPTLVADAASDAMWLGGTALSPAGINNDDPEELCNSSNPRKQKKCDYNGWGNDNWRNLDNDNGDADIEAEGMTLAASTVNGLTVELWMSNEAPDPNTLLNLSVTGYGAPIERVTWRSTGPTADNPTGDDMAHHGELVYDCAGVQPCASTWTVVPRHNGYYSVYARVRDTAGQEIETVWRFTSGHPPQ